MLHDFQKIKYSTRFVASTKEKQTLDFPSLCYSDEHWSRIVTIAEKCMSHDPNTRPRAGVSIYLLLIFFFDGSFLTKFKGNFWFGRWPWGSTQSEKTCEKHKRERNTEKRQRQRKVSLEKKETGNFIVQFQCSDPKNCIGTFLNRILMISTPSRE